MSQIHRRKFLLGAGALVAAAPLARAQAQKRIPTLGILSPFVKPALEAISKSRLIIRLSELGWIEDETLHVERAFAENDFNRLPQLAATLVEHKVDVIWTWGPAAAVAAARATRTIPIVFWYTALPIELGLIESNARPGRNATGTAWSAASLTETNLKQAQLLREITPQARRLARIKGKGWLRTVAGDIYDFSKDDADLDAGLRKLGFEPRAFEVRTNADLDAAFDAIVQWGADSLFVPAGDVIARAGPRIVEFARRNRLADAHSFQHLVQQGGLIAYSFNHVPSLLRTAEYVDRILRGAKPADLPVELPRHYTITVNLKTAKALGLTVPPSVLIQADRVIE